MRKGLVLLLLLAVMLPARAEEIRHRFLALDESRSQLLYVDQTDPARDWVLKLPGRYRDFQLIGEGKLLLSTLDGFREYRLADRQLLREVKGFPGSTSVRRLPDGRTVLACNQGGVTLYELSPEAQVLRKAHFDAAQTRLVRLTPQGTFLFGCGEHLYEGDWSGNLVHTFTLPPGSWVYQAMRGPDGHLLAACGYNPCLVELDAEGKVLKTWGGKQAPEAKELGYFFFGGMQLLRGGDRVVVNWTGHGAEDSLKGTQIVQLNPAGQVVWKWHDPARAGSLHGVILLDDLDPSVLNDDVSSVLGPAGGR